MSWRQPAHPNLRQRPISAIATLYAKTAANVVVMSARVDAGVAAGC